MPGVLNKQIYNAVHSATLSVLKDESLTKPLFETKPAYSAVYRYSGYSSQPAENVNKIWSPLDKDKGNRWTGSGFEKGTGSQGLYLTAEAKGNDDTHFLELEHYQPKETDANDSISFLQGKDSAWRSAKASELYTMFMFTTNEETTGFDLTYDKGKDFLEAVWDKAKSIDPAAFKRKPYDTMTAKEAYNDSIDASFDRAMGNAIFKETDVDYFRTDSVRNEYTKEAENMIMRAEHGKGVDALDAQGRITFYTDKDGKNAQPVYTVDDLIYNQKFDELNKTNAPVNEEEAKYIKGVEDEREKIETAINKVESDVNPDWSFAGNAVDSLIDGKIKEAITKKNIDLTANDFDLDDIVISLTSEGDLKLESNVRTHLDNYMWMNLGGELQKNDDLKLITITDKDGNKRVDEDGIKALAEYVVVQPKYDSIKKEEYISKVVKETVINERFRKLIESSTTLQEEAILCRQKIEDNNSQKDNIEKDLKDLQDKMGDNHDLNQSDQAAKLDKELKELEDKNKDLESEAKSKDDQNDKEMDKANDLEQQKVDAEKDRDASHVEIFK